jgi:hypothetical protein
MKKEKEETHQNEILPITYMGLDVTRKIGLHRILKVVCDELGANIDDVTSKKRQREITDARHIFCYLASKAYGRHTLKQIGKLVNRDHASVLHAKRKVIDLMEFDREINAVVNAIIRRLGKFSANDVYNNEVNNNHVGWYCTPKRKEVLQTWADSNDVVSKITIR